MMFQQPICWECKHFIAETYTCIAFPTGIPDEITENMNKHEKPLPDQDNDIIFTPIEN